MRIAVIYGGTSSERNVSLISGTAMVQAAQALGHEVTPWDTAFGNKQPVHVIAGVGERPPETGDLKALPAEKNSENLFDLVRMLQERKIDLVVNGLHGGVGENGVIQSLLEISKVPYTGSGVMASALAMNKVVTKRLIESAGVPTPAFRFYDRLTELEQVRGELFAAITFPMVIKPNEDGSSVGLTIVKEESQLDAAWRLAAEHGNILVEKFIEGRELTVAVLGDTALPIVEIKPEGGVYDYLHKYTKGMTQYECPAQLSEEVVLQAQTHALTAFEITGCKGYARIDFRMDEDNRLYCLEINTLPGMTATSLVPKAAKAAGIEFNSLMSKIIQLAHE